MWSQIETSAAAIRERRIEQHVGCAAPRGTGSVPAMPSHVPSWTLTEARVHAAGHAAFFSSRPWHWQCPRVLLAWDRPPAHISAPRGSLRANSCPTWSTRADCRAQLRTRGRAEAAPPPGPWCEVCLACRLSQPRVWPSTHPVSALALELYGRYLVGSIRSRRRELRCAADQARTVGIFET